MVNTSSCVFSEPHFYLIHVMGNAVAQPNKSVFWERHAVSREEVSCDPGRGCRAETVLTTLQAFCRHEVNCLDAWRHSVLSLKETAFSVLSFSWNDFFSREDFFFFKKNECSYDLLQCSVLFSSSLCSPKHHLFISVIHSLSTQMCKPLSLGFFGVVWQVGSFLWCLTCTCLATDHLGSSVILITYCILSSSRNACRHFLLDSESELWWDGTL